jgi:hypothetical protein
MIRPNQCLAPLALMLAALSLPALAGSSASSTSSDSASTSLGSLSTSFEKSSNSSSSGDKVAEGEYRIIEVAAAEQRPGTARLKLQAVAQDGAEGELYLYLPQQTAQAGALAAGQVVRATARPYGIEFAKAEVPFFLVLRDDWYRELNTKVVAI